MRIAGILLAAGAGARFGGGKLLAKFADGTTVGRRACANLVAAVADVIAVVRPGDDELAQELAAAGARVTVCPNAQAGMGASLAHGVEAARNAGGWVIALGDMPRIRPDTIKLVAQALNDGAEIVAPAYRGERGHPVGFSARFRSELTALSGDSGARAVLERHQDKIRLIECDDPGVMFDIDRRDDLGRAV